MPIKSRPYAGDADLEKIKGLLMAGRAASPHSSYMHLSDLDWRLYHLRRDADRSQLIHLWEDEGGRLLGWALLDGTDIETYVLPHLRGSDLEAELFTWAEARIRS